MVYYTTSEIVPVPRGAEEEQNKSVEGVSGSSMEQDHGENTEGIVIFEFNPASRLHCPILTCHIGFPLMK